MARRFTKPKPYVSYLTPDDFMNEAALVFTEYGNSCGQVTEPPTPILRDEWPLWARTIAGLATAETSPSERRAPARSARRRPGLQEVARPACGPSPWLRHPPGAI